MKKIWLTLLFSLMAFFSVPSTKLHAAARITTATPITRTIALHEDQEIRYAAKETDRTFQASLIKIWKLVKNFFKTGLSSLEAGLEHLGEHLTPVGSNETGKIRQGNRISEAEATYLAKRSPVIKKALEQLLNESLNDNEVPTIAVAFTGGGYRAMVETIGFLAGAEKTGLLNATSYVTGLSGSTWALVPWITSNLSVDSYRTILADNLDDSFWSRLLFEAKEMPKIISMLAFKKLYKQHIGLVDVYGATVNARLLEGITTDKHKIRFSDLKKNLADGNKPLPICTAIEKNNDRVTWFEFSPLEVGTHQFGGVWIETKFLGRKFNTGVTSNDVPEIPLSTLIGTWGSAYALDLPDLKFALSNISDSITNQANSKERADLAADHKLSFPTLLHPYKRLFPAKVGNFMRGITEMPTSKEKLIKLIDGGHDIINSYRHNFASIPALWRAALPATSPGKVDLLIMYDEAKKPHTKHLHATEERARTLGLPFPKIDYEAAQKNLVTVFHPEKGQDCPTIIYILGKEQEGYNKQVGKRITPLDFTTTKFHYSKEETMEFSGLAEYIMNQSHKTIVSAIKDVVHRKRAH